MSEKFNLLPPAPLDQIMQANAEWPEFMKMHAEPVNTTIGVLTNPTTGEIWRPNAVVEAGDIALRSITKSVKYGYQSPQGHLGFLAEAQKFVYGDNERAEDDVTAYQALGGTGALRLTNEVLGTLLRDDDGERPLLLDPGWANHRVVFGSNFDISTYGHRSEDDTYNHEGALEAIAGQPDGSTVLLQVSGYNDDGLDRTPQQWDDILSLAQDKEMTVILDGAYLGVSGPVEEGAYPIRQARDLGLLTLVNASMSKNMGLYNERVGALFIANAKRVLGDEQARNLDQTVKRTIRGIWSNPPLLFAETARLALAGSVNGFDYREELASAAEQLQANRQQFAAIVGHRLPSVGNGRGLFTVLLREGFSEAQHLSLKQAGIHALPSSRINIGGIRTNHIEKVGLAVLKALDVREA